MISTAKIHEQTMEETKSKILIVEDSEAAANLLASILTENNYNVTGIVEKGEEAILLNYNNEKIPIFKTNKKIWLKNRLYYLISFTDAKPELHGREHATKIFINLENLITDIDGTLQKLFIELNTDVTKQKNVEKQLDRIGLPGVFLLDINDI